MKRLMLKLTLVGTILALLLAIAVPGIALAAPPDEENPFVCPSVNPNNPNGMWLIGAHGAYYVIVPTRGHDGVSKIHVKIPDHVEDQAQTSAGWGLYHKVPSYPYFEGMTMVLHPDGKEFIWEQFEIDIGMAMTITVVMDGTPSWDEGTKTLYANVPLFAAAFW